MKEIGYSSGHRSGGRRDDGDEGSDGDDGEDDAYRIPVHAIVKHGLELLILLRLIGVRAQRRRGTGSLTCLLAPSDNRIRILFGRVSASSHAIPP